MKKRALRDANTARWL